MISTNFNPRIQIWILSIQYIFPSSLKIFYPCAKQEKSWNHTETFGQQSSPPSSTKWIKVALPRDSYPLLRYMLFKFSVSGLGGRNRAVYVWPATTSENLFKQPWNYFHNDQYTKLYFDFLYKCSTLFWLAANWFRVWSFRTLLQVK